MRTGRLLENCLMIEYRFPEEKEFILFYAKKSEASEIVSIVQRGYVQNAAEAQMLANFFWQMVDNAVQDESNGSVASEIAAKGRELTEVLLSTISNYLIKAGYGREWDAAADAA